MSKTVERSFKSIAKEAKTRLKSGFWQNCKEELSDELERARTLGVSESRACRYFTGKVTCTIRGGGEDDAFYEKVRALLVSEGEVSDAIGRLTDHSVYDKLSYEEKTALHPHPFRAVFKGAGKVPPRIGIQAGMNTPQNC